MKTLHTIFSIFAKRNMESLRLLLVMLLILTVSSNMWGADYTLITDVSHLSNGDKVIIATNNNGKPSTGVKGGTVQESTSEKKDATVSSTEADWMQFTVTTTTNGWYLSNTSSQYIGKPTANTFYLTTTTNSKGVCSVNGDGVFCCNNRYLQKNSTYYRMYSGINNSYTPFYVWKVSASYTITAQSNNTNYGTVSLNGTTITASPNTGYRVRTTNPYIISPDGSATISQNGNTFNVTPSANCTITIYFEEIPKYTINWYVNGEVYETTQVSEGIKPTFPTTPNSCDATSTTFYGWATDTWSGKINDISTKTIYTSANNMPAEGATYHAVFCEGSNGTELINEEFDNSSTSDATSAFNSNTFTNFSGTVNKAYKSKYGGVKFGTNSASGDITSKALDLSSAFTVTLDACKYGSDSDCSIKVIVGSQSKTIAHNILDAAGTFNTYTLEFDAATVSSTVKIGTLSQRAYIDNVIIATEGDVSNYITSCCTNSINIIKGTAENGTFEVIQTGKLASCDEVTLTVITYPADHYHVLSVTATNPTTTGSAQVTDNGDGTWTVTYTANSNGDTQIDVEFEEDTKFEVRWYVNGVALTGAELGEASTKVYENAKVEKIPENPEPPCDDVFVGWIDAEMDVDDTAEPSNLYLQQSDFPEATDNQNFYAVFADYVTE